jgi:hypothetical protein
VLHVKANRWAQERRGADAVYAALVMHVLGRVRRRGVLADAVDARKSEDAEKAAGAMHLNFSTLLICTVRMLVDLTVHLAS